MKTHLESITEELSKIRGVRLIMLGGSRATGKMDNKSDIDLYVYTDEPIPLSLREEILAKHFDYLELANSFWEEEDDGILTDGIELEIIYRKTSFIDEVYEAAYVHPRANFGYSTCMIHNLQTSLILFDDATSIQELRGKYKGYPEELREAILKKNGLLISNRMPSLSFQLTKAIRRKDLISIQHRTTEYLAMYFDVLFAANRRFHPGEKRLLEAMDTFESMPTNAKQDIGRLLKVNTMPVDEAVSLVDVISKEMNAFIAREVRDFVVCDYFKHKA
ncbi:MAG: hypothetical protein A2Y20_02280 [Firmicutes bacterium GWF2_51_9]|nr:MAG: hypothetical protein A2Y20_02280 [Firmicutes bacterium GWF2_51_9]OGS59174.1 MAG: hypothetical protein A2Y19_00815 [Firmicutes bacterium GWE2_51_13]HAM62149.1 hypothetical protein [Erysipelotrichaceae bacterium]HBZ41736.1 hypothetical protein [Erysipelotrichaceae bacterium]